MKTNDAPGPPPRATHPDPAETPPGPTPEREFILLAAEARHRGFKNGLAFRRFCARNDIPIIKVAKKQFVRPRDIDAAILRNSAPARRAAAENISAAKDVLRSRR